MNTNSKFLCFEQLMASCPVFQLVQKSFPKFAMVLLAENSIHSNDFLEMYYELLIISFLLHPPNHMSSYDIALHNIT